VAGGAIGAKAALVGIVFLMAGDALLGGALVHAVDVARATDSSLVGAGKGERGAAVVEGRALPGGGAVAGSAVAAELALVDVVLLMAGDALGGGALVLAVSMAPGAGGGLVGAGEGERGAAVVEGRALPGGGVVAGSAVAAVLASVYVVFLMAGDALHRRSSELTPAVTVQASHLDMGAR